MHHKHHLKKARFLLISWTVFRSIKKDEIASAYYEYTLVSLSLYPLWGERLSKVQNCNFYSVEANSSVYCFCTTLLWLIWTAILDKAWQLAILTWKNFTPQFQSQGVLQFLCLPTIYIPVSFGVCSFLIMLWLFRPHVAGHIIVLYPVTHAWNSWNLYCFAVTSIKNVLGVSHQNFKRCPNRTGRPWASSTLKMWADPLLLLNIIFKMDPIQLWRFQWTWWSLLSSWKLEQVEWWGQC